MANARLAMKVIQSAIVAFARGVQHLPTLTFCDMFESKFIRYDPKDGELWLSRVKAKETSLEARSRSDVQIDDRT